MTPPATTHETDRGVILLAIGDVHLGTQPGSIPADMAECGIDPRDLAPEAALGAAVDRAIADEVDAVLFAGDVVESTNARFEAIRPLEAAIQRLSDAAIPVLAVVGNHDVEALPRLGSLIDGLTLLGLGGHWQFHLIEKHGEPIVEIVGWSFSERRVMTSPVADLLRAPVARARPDLPRIGILHGDLGASGGHYAPFSRQELEATAFDAWLLGHIHGPSLGSAGGPGGAGPCGYLGSLVGLDPSETGAHGPWSIHVGGAGRVHVQQLPIAPLRWERIDVELDEATTVDDVGDLLLDAAERVGRSIQEQGPAPRALGVRVQLIGATRHYDAISGRAKAGHWNDLRRVVRETVVFVERVIDGLDLLIDLEEISRGDDPPALLARKLLALRRGGDERRELLDLARSELRPLADDPRWAPVSDIRDGQDPLTDEALSALLEQASKAALHALLAQREDTGGSPS